MALAFSVKVTGVKKLNKKLRQIDPEQNTKILRRALDKAGLLVQKIAATDKIVRGGSGPPLADRLTSRTGALRRSIRVNRAPFPHAIEIGTDLGYGAVHELGLGAATPRPFLSPALKDAETRVRRFFEDEIRREIRK